jgi:glycosyltransferase involved in cell wall biosynthesis
LSGSSRPDTGDPGLAATGPLRWGDRTCGWEMNVRPCLSLVMPAYNEEGTVLHAVERVLEQPFVAQLVVVNDASTDSTADLLGRIDDPRVLVLTQPINRGKGAALRTGFAAATADYVGIQDADLEYNPADLAKLLVPLEEGLADVVYGSRFLTGDAHRVLLFWHSIGNKVLTLASNAFANVNLTDMETCYKVFRRELIQSIPIEEDRFGFEPEITIKVARRRARIYEVGVSYSGRSYEDGKKIGWKDGVSAARCIVKYAWKERHAGRAPAFHTKNP